MVNYSYIYSGKGYPLDTGYGNFIGYRIGAGKLGAPLKPDTAAQIVEATNMLNQGIKPIEVGVLSPEVFEQIPKQHFKEINRLAKLTGASASMHAPLVEPSGFVEQNWSAENQKIAENRLTEVIEKAHDLNPDGNVIVTVHSSNIPGSTFHPSEKGAKESQIVVINKETGRVAGSVKEEERYDMESGKKKVFSPQDELNRYNKESWENTLDHFAYNSERAEELINVGEKVFKEMGKKEERAGVALDIYKQYVSGRISEEELKEKYPEVIEGIPDLKHLKRMNRTGEFFLRSAYRELNDLYHSAYRNAVENKNEEGREDIQMLNKFQKEVEKNSNKINQGDADTINEIISRGIDTLGKLKSRPKMLVPIEEFAMDKSTDTLSNVALNSYKKFGNSAPIISVENLFPGMAFSRPEDFKEMVDKTKNKFVEKAVKQGMMSSEKAKEMANKVIGVTWDVGHLNMMRKQGFKEEDIIKATELVGKNIKHVHMTDNFGHSDSHLPPGMGNVPIKKILEQMEKAGVLENVKMINEAGGFVQHFGKSPHPYAMEAFGGAMFEGGPYWNQGINAFGNYFSGYGTTLPEQHFSIYGSGLSGLPTELGGQIPGKQSRFSGTPNA